MNSTKVNQLQLLQHNLQNVSLQKQQIENNLVELDSALTELKTTEKAYKIVGKIMIASDTASLQKDLQEQKEAANVRLKSFSRQEEKLRSEFEKIQREAMEELNNATTDSTSA